jgi:hypothetical protein
MQLMKKTIIHIFILLTNIKTTQNAALHSFIRGKLLNLMKRKLVYLSWNDMAADLCYGTVRSIIYIQLVPFLIKLLGRLIMRKAVIDNTSVPISSSRNPSHSFAA